MYGEQNLLEFYLYMAEKLWMTQLSLNYLTQFYTYRFNFRLLYIVKLKQSYTPVDSYV